MDSSKPQARRDIPANGRAGDRRPPALSGAPAQGPAQSDGTARERKQAANAQAGDRRPPALSGAPAQGPAQSDGTARERSQALNGRAGDRRPPALSGAPAQGPARSGGTARERSQALNAQAGDRRPPGFPGAPAQGPARSDATARERKPSPDSRKIPPFPRPWPVFKVPDIPRGFGTDAQWELGERERADYYRNMGIILGLMQWVCTRLGNHRRCRLRVCRRKRRCAGRRPEDRWNDGFLFPLVPPCEPIEDERIYQLRDEVNQVLWQAECRGAQTPPPPPVRCAAVPLVFDDGETPVRDAGRAGTADGATGRPGRADA